MVFAYEMIGTVISFWFSSCVCRRLRDLTRFWGFIIIGSKLLIALPNLVDGFNIFQSFLSLLENRVTWNILLHHYPILSPSTWPFGPLGRYDAHGQCYPIPFVLNFPYMVPSVCKSPYIPRIGPVVYNPCICICIACIFVCMYIQIYTVTYTY